jgi:hypothetical protein
MVIPSRVWSQVELVHPHNKPDEITQLLPKMVSVDEYINNNLKPVWRWVVTL